MYYYYEWYVHILARTLRWDMCMRMPGARGCTHNTLCACYIYIYVYACVRVYDVCVCVHVYCVCVCMSVCMCLYVRAVVGVYCVYILHII